MPQPEYQIEKESTMKQDSSGLKIVIFGALASILLWYAVSIIGKPITAAGIYSPLYIASITAPAILISAYAIYQIRKHRNC
ncbi:MAG: hypothetical protein OK457_11225 [Thaumarchaeota archaeon]|nr:hypothetical protein [Nitrososphaerota archaeon]